MSVMFFSLGPFAVYILGIKLDFFRKKRSKIKFYVNVMFPSCLILCVNTQELDLEFLTKYNILVHASYKYSFVVKLLQHKSWKELQCSFERRK